MPRRISCCFAKYVAYFCAVGGKRDYVIIALLVGCALRRRELATLDIEDIQLREGRWVIIDLLGKGGRIRTVAIPIWVKHGINAWMTAAKIEDGRLLGQYPSRERFCGMSWETGPSGR